MATKAKNKETEQGYGNCPICGRVALGHYAGSGQLTMIEGPGALKLRDGAHLCGSCVRALRVMFPLDCAFDEGKRELVRRDPLAALSTEEALEARKQLTAFREDLRARYGFRSAVFEVDAAAESKEGLLQAPIVSFFGQVVYGSFWINDEVTILSGGGETKATLIAIDDYVHRIPFSGLKDWMRRINPVFHVGENGYPCLLAVQAKGISVRHGDLIVKD